MTGGSRHLPSKMWEGLRLLMALSLLPGLQADPAVQWDLKPSASNRAHAEQVVVTPVGRLPSWQEEMRLCYLMGPIKGN